MSTKTYRKGPIGALIDEYERAADALCAIVDEISDEAYELVRDTETTDEDCRSIRTILTHVMQAGYGYAGMLRTAWGLERLKRWHEPLPRRDVRSQIAAMLAYTCATLDGRWDISDGDAEALQLRSGSGTVYDLEQLLEHAIVHVLRHRRQIERFLGR